MRRSILILLLVFTYSNLIHAQSPCTPAVNGNTYQVTTDADGGPGSLRQAILDANADNTGGLIEIPGAIFSFPIFSPLPVVTVDSLVIFHYFVPISIDGQGFVSEPVLTFGSSLSCAGNYVTIVNTLPGNIVVTSTSDDGPGSLRQAIISANFSASADIIVFNIPGPAPHKIELDTTLPLITKPLTIDGSTQPANGYTGSAPKIEIVGDSTSYDGLYFYYSQNSQIYDAAVYGLYLHDFFEALYFNQADNVIVGAPGKGNVISGNKYGLLLAASKSNVVRNNYIGTDTSGTLPEGNFNEGITVIGSPVQTHLIENNVVSGNETEGVLIYNNVENLIFRGNIVGTDKTGTYAIPNKHTGVWAGGSKLIFGGTQPGDMNLFSGNCPNILATPQGALVIDGDSVSIIGNRFGTNLTGTDSIPNSHGDAILMNGRYGKIGGTPAEGNLVSASRTGILFGYFSSNCVIKNNIVGTDVTGTLQMANESGISIAGDSILVTSNVVAYNRQGISLVYTSTDNLVFENEIHDNTTQGIWNWGQRNTFSQNSIYNNLEGIFQYLDGNDSIMPPVVTSVNPNNISGTSLPNATIELFYSLPGNINPQGAQLIATVTADALGEWNYSGSLTSAMIVTATQTDTAGNTSAFSEFWPVVTPTVWPGDCNYDLVADNFDFIFLGMAMNHTGPVRNNATINWTPQPAADWDSTYFNGVNYKHADCNGDGFVNLTDADAINQNYGLTHPFRMSQTAAVYDFYLVSVNDTVGAGDVAQFAIYAGNSSLPIDSVYGISFSLSYNSAIADTNNISFDFTNSTFGVLQNDFATFEKSYYSGGISHLAVSRINQQNLLNAGGPVGFISIPFLPSFSEQIQVVNPFEVRGLTLHGTPVNFTVAGDSVLMNPLISGIPLNNLQNEIYVYPQPASDELTVICYNNLYTDLTLYNAAGQIVSTQHVEGIKNRINTSSLAPGFYTLKLGSPEGAAFRKVILSNQ